MSAVSAAGKSVRWPCRMPAEEGRWSSTCFRIGPRMPNSPGPISKAGISMSSGHSKRWFPSPKRSASGTTRARASEPDEGSPLEVLLRRLLETPAEFLAEPRVGTAGEVDVAAVVWDVLRDLDDRPLDEAELAPFRPAGTAARQQ